MDKQKEYKKYEDKLDAQLKKWSEQIWLLKTKADNVKADVKTNTTKPSKPCNASRMRLPANLREMKTAGDDA